MATLYGIGVGPGDPELMTLKAVKLCQSCSTLALPHKDPERCLAFRIAKGAVPELAQKEILAIDMPMTKDAAVLEAAYKKGTETLIHELDQGKDIVFLTLGDPTVYSTYLYLHHRVKAAGYNTEIVPGITSFCASAAALGISLCENKDEVHIIPGTYNATAALDYPGTKIFMKNNLSETRAALQERGAQAFMVENCGLPNQHLYQSLEEIPEDAGYYSVVIVKD